MKKLHLTSTSWPIWGSLYRSTGHYTNGPKFNGLQVNCSVHQPKLVGVQNQILTNMLYKSTAPSFNQRWTKYQFGNILLYRSTKHIDLKSIFLQKMVYSSTNFFVVFVERNFGLLVTLSLSYNYRQLKSPYFKFVYFLSQGY